MTTLLSREAIANSVLDAVREAAALAQGEVADPAAVNEETRLIGPAAVLDSMGLVSAILDIEQRLADDYDLVLALADERAMSQKNSPFRSVQTLAEYVYQRAQAAAAGAQNGHD